MLRSDSIFILCPVYFDIESFLILRTNILYELKKLNRDTLKIQFILVDDSAGRDPSVSEIKSLPDVIVIVPPFNLGHQRAIVFGIRSCFKILKDQDILVTLDSDGEDRPQDLVAMIEILAKENSSLVLARRTERAESFVFKTCYFFYKMIFKFFTGEVIRSGNYAVHRCQTLKQVIYHPYFDLCYSSSMVALRIAKEFHYCPRGTRYKGQSKMNFSSLVMHGIRMLMPFIDKVATRALIIFSLGLCLSLISVFIIISIRIFTDLSIPGWASYLVTMFSLFSFVALGNFAILFTIYSYGQGKSLRSLEEYNPQVLDLKSL